MMTACSDVEPGDVATSTKDVAQPLDLGTPGADVTVVSGRVTTWDNCRSPMYLPSGWSLPAYQEGLSWYCAPFEAQGCIEGATASEPGKHCECASYFPSVDVGAYDRPAYAPPNCCGVRTCDAGRPCLADSECEGRCVLCRTSLGCQNYKADDGQWKWIGPKVGYCWHNKRALITGQWCYLPDYDALVCINAEYF